MDMEASPCWMMTVAGTTPGWNVQPLCSCSMIRIRASAMDLIVKESLFVKPGTVVATVKDDQRTMLLHRFLGFDAPEGSGTGSLWCA